MTSDDHGRRATHALGAAGMSATLVSDAAPRLFALVAGFGSDNQSSGEILAWGLEFDDGAHIVGYDGTLTGSFSSAERARRLFSRVGRMVDLVWCPPDGDPRIG